MKKSFSQEIFTCPANGSAVRTLSIQHSLWTEAIRPEDARDLRLNKIVHLRSMIAAGIYRISSANLAEKLIDHMRNNS